MPPGTRALAFASRWFDTATVASVFEPLIADWQREWREAAGFARFGVRIRGGSALLLTMIAASPNVLFAPWPASTLRRVMTRVAIWTTVVTALNLTPFVIDLGRRFNVDVLLYLSVLLLPQAVAVAFPFAITTVVDVIRTGAEPTREERIAAARFGIAAVVLMMVLVGWGFPAANQQFRVASFRAVREASGLARDFGPARGLNELSIVELFQDDRLRSQGHPSGDPIYDAWNASAGRAGAESVRRVIAQRTFLMVIPIVLIWMRWRALLLPRGHWYSPLPLVLSAPLLFGSCMFLLRGFAVGAYAPRWIGPWLAMTVFASASIGIDRLRRRAAHVI